MASDDYKSYGDSMFPSVRRAPISIDAQAAPSNAKSISEVASIYNVTLRTLRFYEERGLLAPLRIGSSRFYFPKDEIILQLILKGKKLGLSITHIGDLISSGATSNPTLSMSLDDIRRQLSLLEAQRDRVYDALDVLYSRLEKIPT